MTIDKWNQKFENYGIVIKELIKNKNNKNYDAIVQYLHTNKIVKIIRIDKFYDSFKSLFKLHKNVLKNTKQYNNTDYYVSPYGDVYTTKCVIKKLIPQIKNNLFIFNMENKNIYAKRLVLDTWGHNILPRPLVDECDAIQPIIITPIRELPKKIHMSLDELKQQLETLGIIVKETYPLGNGKYEATINYLHTNISTKVIELRSFFTNYKNTFKLHKDILQDTKQYKNTHLFVSKNGDVYSVRGVVKLLTPTKNTHRSNGKYVSYVSNKVPVHHMVLEAWGFLRPSPNHIVRHLNDIPDDNRLENLKWDFQLTNMKDKDINGDKRKELLKSLFKTNLYTIEEISILMKTKQETVEGILKTF